MTLPAFPKPGQIKQTRKYLCDDGVFRYPDGREVCAMNRDKGVKEYIRRRRVAWEEQKGICPICNLQLFWKDAESDHKSPRGMNGGKRDDRQENIAAVHPRCNSAKGSKRTGFYDVP